MLAEERWAAILEVLREKRAATIKELSDEIGASESTVRRDLERLDKLGRLSKVYGGATLTGDKFDSGEKDFETKSALNVDEKERIARYAAAQVADGDFIYIDAGTTTLRMVEHIIAKDITVVTNGVDHARRLARRGIRTVMVGGLLRSSTQAVVGASALADVGKYNFNKAFVGINGISVRQGLTMPDSEETQVKIKAIGQALAVYVLADASKFDRVFAVTVAPLDRARIITDKLPGPAYSEHTLICLAEKS